MAFKLSINIGTLGSGSEISLQALLRELAQMPHLIVFLLYRDFIIHS